MKEYKISDILFTRISVKRSMYALSKSVLLNVGIKREP